MLFSLFIYILHHLTLALLFRHLASKVLLLGFSCCQQKHSIFMNAVQSIWCFELHFSLNTSGTLLCSLLAKVGTYGMPQQVSIIVYFDYIVKDCVGFSQFVGTDGDTHCILLCHFLLSEAILCIQSIYQIRKQYEFGKEQIYPDFRCLQIRQVLCYNFQTAALDLLFPS